MDGKESSIGVELIRLREKAKALAQIKYSTPGDRENRFLALAVEAWVQAISQRALSIALLLENSDLDSVLVLLRN